MVVEAERSSSFVEDGEAGLEGEGDGRARVRGRSIVMGGQVSLMGPSPGLWVSLSSEAEAFAGTPSVPLSESDSSDCDPAEATSPSESWTPSVPSWNEAKGSESSPSLVVATTPPLRPSSSTPS